MLLLGLHTSITIHLASNYPLKESNTPFLKNSAEWGPNLELFHQVESKLELERNFASILSIFN